MELHFIVNKFAGNGKGAEMWNGITKELTIPYFKHITNYPGHARQLSKQLALDAFNHNKQILIIAVGGDGTINEIINGIIGIQQVILGAVKGGSGNDYSRWYRVFRNAEEIEQFLRKEGLKSEKMDCGFIQVNDEQRAFVNNAGVGFDAFVAMKTNESNLKFWLNKFGLGKLCYIYYVLVGLITFKTFNLEVIQNGIHKKYEKVWLATISNQPYFGGGMKISPKSVPNDGELELTVVYHLPRVKLLFLFFTVFLGIHTRLSEVEQITAKKFQLTLNGNQFCHTDGEIIHPKNETMEISVTVNEKSWQCVKIV